MSRSEHWSMYSDPEYLLGRSRGAIRAGDGRRIDERVFSRGGWLSRPD
jgi:hypothetical protein